MIFNFIVSLIIIIACAFGLVYWWNNGENVINHFPNSNNCQMGNQNTAESSCSFEQVAVYFIPYFLLVVFISISIAVIYSSCRPVVM
jgi:hypothetical protein